MQEKCIFSPTCLRRDPGTDELVEVPYELYHETVAKNVVGDRLYAFAGAPGTGHVVRVITRIDATGVWGYEVENTVRELEPWEVI